MSETLPSPREPIRYRQFRADLWPLCPLCEQDELYSLEDPPTVESIVGCYRCGPIELVAQKAANRPLDSGCLVDFDECGC